MFIALTGGIAAGKSTVLSILGKMNHSCFDTDLMVHELYESGSELRRTLNEKWGVGLDLDARAARAGVAEIVFANKEKLAELESIIHPLIKERIETLRESCTGLAFCAVPLLFETGFENCFDAVVTVSCPEDIQWKRLQDRGWSQDEAAARLHRQLSMREKEQLSDYVISNIGSLEFLEKQCEKLVGKLSV